MVYLGVNSAGVALPNQDHGDATRWLSGDSSAAACELAMQVFRERPRHTFRKLAVEVQLSGALARPFLFEAVDGLKNWKEALKVASLLAPEATGLAGPCAVWLDDWRPVQRCVGVALEISLRAQIEQITRDAGFRLAVLRPWWTAAIALTRALPKAPAKLLVAEDLDSLTVFTGEGDAAYTAAATYAPKPAPAQARGLVTRAAMAANIPVEAIVSVGLGERLSMADEDPAPPRHPTSLTPTLAPWT